MLSNEIREKFLKYFEKNGHTVHPSSATVPLGDPTLLFTNAGMNQFKDVFLGKSTRDFTRAATSQKCVRVGGKHNDLDNVGHTKRHVTFFEMLGNFSFGDYFKKEAIRFAWEVTRDVFEFPEEKLWVTVYHTDDEAFECWKEHIAEERIVRIDTDDNFWSMGDVGPCGPCTELFYDRGESYGPGTSPADDVDGERFLEFWNLVFMQYNREKSGKKTDLPAPCVDTGAGLERVVALKMDVETVFETDILRAIISDVEKRHGLTYDPKDEKLAPAFHVIADHLRTLCFTIADGAQPSNIERGYVLRKVLRRAVRYGRLLGIDKPFLADLVPTLTKLMGDHFPELKTSEERCQEILTLEEKSFHQTLHKGGNILSGVMERAAKDSAKQISGEDAFKLKDTYGFPLEEILLLAKDAGLTVNLDAYALLEEQARERSKQAHKSHAQVAETNLFSDFLENHPTTTFTGYTEIESEATILALIKGDQFVDSLDAGDEGIVILDTTPFYAEKGGQVGDLGTLTHQKATFAVDDCQAPIPGVTAHIGKVDSGTLLVGEPIIATIEKERRADIEKHHTATHLLHFALTNVLGDHIRQAGSLVESERLRFDFNHHKPLTNEEIRQVETIVNRMIRDGALVDTYELSYAEAQKMPEIKQFFGDKYGQTVRVVDIGESKELCGGTHVANTGAIGLFRIIKRGSIAKGVLRIEALTGHLAENFMYTQEDRLTHIADTIGAPVQKLEEGITTVVAEKNDLKQKVKKFEQAQMGNLTGDLLAKKKNVSGIDIITAKLSLDPKAFATLGNDLAGKLSSGAILLGNDSGDRCQLLIRLSDNLVGQGKKAGDLIRELAPMIGGSGGGKPNAAQAGGTDLSHFDSVVETFERLLTQ